MQAVETGNSAGRPRRKLLFLLNSRLVGKLACVALAALVQPTTGANASTVPTYLARVV